jgi:uncharacterized membrane protein YfhO
MKFCKKQLIFPIILILIGLVFYWPAFLKNKVPFPGDMIVGAYYPWLNEKWGYEAGVPVKNPLISDVYSVNYIEKSLIAESFKKFQLPLWNPYSYSGIPLLANFHSGVFNPFNYLMVFLGNINGWTAMIICQTLGSLLSMFLFLKTLKKSSSASLIGSILYAFSGFSTVWLLYATTGYILMWLPVIFLFIEKYFQNYNLKYLFPLPLLIFLLMSTGHVQLFIYCQFLIGSYIIWKIFRIKINLLTTIIGFIVVYILSFGLMSIQILPTYDLTQKSIRISENFIQSANFGLLPLSKTITLFAPDFFGNPTTYNYWGFFDYNETILYVSILGLMSLIYAIYNFKHLSNEKFFLILSLISLLLIFDNPISKLIYLFKIPIISTSAAGRMAIIFTFCISVLTAVFIDHLFSLNFKKFLHYFWGLLVYLLITILIVSVLKLNFNDPNINTAFRNLAFPSLIFLFNIFAIICFKNKNISKTLICFILILDLFRFGWKYLPFVEQKMVYPSTPLIEFLKNQPGFFRIEKENGALLPPNTWAAYHLSSSSGYEPMAISQYTDFYNKTLNFAPDYANSSRYSELSHYDASKLGEFNVKYLIAFKYDDHYKISANGKFLNPEINLHDWQKVYEENNLVILENKLFQPRVRFSDNSDPKGTLKITNYQSNQIDIQYQSSNPNTIILTNTWESGWTAKLNSQTIPISIFNQTFDSIKVPAGKGTINLKYYPKSLALGKILFYISLAIYFIIVLIFLIKKNKTK